MGKKVRKIGIGFITGRKSFRDVLTTYMQSWGGQVLLADEPVELSLFVAYDLDYNNTKRSDYTNINIELREMLESIHFIDRTSLRTEMRSLVAARILTMADASLLFEKGYAGKRNAILYTAIKQDMDAVLFLDDDEYPLAVLEEKGLESWIGQQILGTHLKYIDNASITNGHHCGYVSPVPALTFNDVLSEEVFGLFVESISNDIINWESMQKIMGNGGITYADPTVFLSDASDVAQVNGAKFISGSNLCINLHDPITVRPFYNPPGARGEDTFLSTCLQDRTVLSIPCYTFHDGFSLYNSMLHGVLPRELRHVSANTKKVVQRFLNACIGWVRYKPLFLYITRREQYPHLINASRQGLEKTLPALTAYFDNPKFLTILDEFDKYAGRVEGHYASFEQTKTTWNALMTYLSAKN